MVSSKRLLKIRTKKSNQSFFRLNRAQQEYSLRCAKQNVVLKARQVGITTYIAARFFVQTITQRGTLSDASDAGPGIGGGHFPDRAAVLGELAGGGAERRI